MSTSDESVDCMNNSDVNNRILDSKYWTRAPIPSTSSCSVVSDPQESRRTPSVDIPYQRKKGNKKRCNAKTNKINIISKIHELENEISNMKTYMNNLYSEVSKISSIGNTDKLQNFSPIFAHPNGEGFGGKRSRRRRRKSVKRKRKQSKKNHRKTRR